MDKSGGVHRLYHRFVARVQRTLLPSIRVDVDESKNAPMVRRPRSVNFGRYLWPETLGS